MNPAPVHILGGGSIGLLLASRLSAVAPVTLIRRPGARCSSTQRILYRFEDRATEVTVQQTPGDHPRGPLQQLIVCTKAYDAEAAVGSMIPYLQPHASVLLMQNGMGSQERIAAAWPHLNLHAGTSTEGAYRLTHAEVVHAGRGLTRIGPLQGEPHPWHELFQQAGLQAEAVDTIGPYLADKLRINALINPLTVVYGCRNGELLGNDEAVDRMKRLGDEADVALAAAGFEFSEPAFERAAAVARTTADNVSSMLQDSRAGRRLELAAITGYLVELGERLGVDVGAHRAILSELR